MILFFFKLRERASSGILHAAVKFLGYKYKMSCKSGEQCGKTGDMSRCYRTHFHQEAVGTVKNENGENVTQYIGCTGDPPSGGRRRHRSTRNRRNKNRSTRNRRNKNRSTRNRRNKNRSTRNRR
jgi:hypothetical protein